MMILETLALAGLVLSLLGIALAAEAIVWSVPAYKRFKQTTHILEAAVVGKVHGRTLKEGVTTLKMISHWRLVEAFETPSLASRAGFDMNIEAVFGAMFLKDASIDESLGHLQISSWIVLAGLILVGLLGIALNPIAVGRIERATLWEKAPLMFGYAIHYHGILYVELAIIVFTIFSLMRDSLLLRRINRMLDE